MTATATAPPTLVERAAALVRHPDGCPADVRERIGARGDPQVICQSCGHFQFLTDVLPMPEAEDLTYSARHIRHDDGCPRGRLEVKRGKFGDTLVTCLGCFKWAPLRHAPEPEDDTAPRTTTTTATTTATTPRPAPVLYACRPHYRPTTWRGTGCPQCDAERRESQHSRRLKRATTTTGETR